MHAVKHKIHYVFSILVYFCHGFATHGRYQCIAGNINEFEMYMKYLYETVRKLIRNRQVYLLNDMGWNKYFTSPLFCDLATHKLQHYMQRVSLP